MIFGLVTINQFWHNGMQTYCHSFGRSGNPELVDSKENEGNELCFLLDLKRPTNFVFYCDKLFQAVLRRIFHRRTLISLNVFTGRMDRTGAAYTGFEGHPHLCTLQINPSKKAGITHPSLAGTTDIPQLNW